MENKGICIFLKTEIVQGKHHDICQNPQMRETNKVENDKELVCMGERCGLAVYKKDDN